MGLLLRMLVMVPCALAAAVIFFPFFGDVIIPDELKPKAAELLATGKRWDLEDPVRYGAGVLFTAVTGWVLYSTVPKKKKEKKALVLKPGQKANKKLAQQLMVERRFKEAAEMFK